MQVTTAINPPPYYNKPFQYGDEFPGMQYVRLGQTGVVVSRICLGLMTFAQMKPGEAKMAEWIIPHEEAEPFFKQALDAGINFFNTAEWYSRGRSEEFFGNALKKYLPQSRFTRADIVIVTKVAPTRDTFPNSTYGGLQRGLSRKALFDAVEGSLKRLQVDYIDVLNIARYDPNTSPEETMRALHDLVQMGKIRYIGASAMYVWQLSKLQHVAEKNGWTKFTVMENHYNAIYREEEREMIPYCIDNGIACVPWAPLAAGVLTRLPDSTPSTRQQTDFHQKARYYKANDDSIIREVVGIAKARDIPPAQVALAWILQRPGIAAPIIGATKVHHITDAVKALQVKLTDDEIKRIESTYEPHAIVGHM